METTLPIIISSSILFFVANFYLFFVNVKNKK